MPKYFSRHLTKLFRPRDLFLETTVTPKDPSQEILNHFSKVQNLQINFKILFS